MDIVTAGIFLSALVMAFLLMDRFADSGGKRKKPDRPGTRIVPSLYMHQMDQRTKRSIKRFDLNDKILSGGGYFIYGSNSIKVPRVWGLKLSKVCPEAETVSADHARIVKEDDSYYIERNWEKDAPMVLSGQPGQKDRICIENEMTVYLGQQPLKFMFVDTNYTWEDGEGVSVEGNPDVRKKPVRRHKPGSAR